MKKIAGADGFNIAGHKISWTMLGALGAIIGAFLVWRQFQAGGVSAGAASAGSPAAATSPDIATDPVIQNLMQEIGQLQANQGAPAAQPAASPAAPLGGFLAGTQGPPGRGRGVTQSAPFPGVWDATLRTAVTKSA